MTALQNIKVFVLFEKYSKIIVFLKFLMIFKTIKKSIIVSPLKFFINILQIPFRHLSELVSIFYSFSFYRI